jgi:hypothetical protein
MSIIEIDAHLKKMPPIKESMNIFLEGINRNLPCRNGFVWAISGSGGSGKSSMLLNFFKSPDYYRGKFDNVYVFTPLTSFLSVHKHPFEKHDKVFHDIDEEILEDIETELLSIKEECLTMDCAMENSLIIIDDMGGSLKDKHLVKALNKMILKTRHISCSWVFTLQSYFMLPKILRKQMNYITVFKPKNTEEWASVAKEVFQIAKDKQQELYDYCFSEPYQHLDIDLFSGRMYKNFNLIEFKK